MCNLRKRGERMKKEVITVVIYKSGRTYTIHNTRKIDYFFNKTVILYVIYNMNGHVTILFHMTLT